MVEEPRTSGAACAGAGRFGCRYHLDLTVPDVADALGIRLGTAKARLSRAVGRLRAELRDDQA